MTTVHDAPALTSDALADLRDEPHQVRQTLSALGRLLGAALIDRLGALSKEPGNVALIQAGEAPDLQRGDVALPRLHGDHTRAGNPKCR